MTISADFAPLTFWHEMHVHRLLTALVLLASVFAMPYPTAADKAKALEAVAGTKPRSQARNARVTELARQELSLQILRVSGCERSL